jgi:nucleotide-binding universal stress UspA family protein
MRVLIGYNGSEAAMAALEDLQLAGFPDGTEALVFTVAESWARPTTLDEALSIAGTATAAINRAFPTWNVKAETALGSPAREILARAETFAPDVIIVGEPHRLAEAGNIFLGHTSQAILAQAACSVRIARSRITADAPGRRSARILVGFDGSVTAQNAVDMIAGRKWPEGTIVRLLAVTDTSALASIGQPIPQIKDAVVEGRFASRSAESLAAESLDKLRAAGLCTSIEVRFGHPMEAIVQEAGRWKADGIFVGPHCAPNSFERYLIGSVSSGVASRAGCTVEVARTTGTF